MKKECLVCGNTNKKELEPVTLYSDGEGNDEKSVEYICKEGEGCNK